MIIFEFKALSGLPVGNKYHLHYKPNNNEDDGLKVFLKDMLETLIRCNSYEGVASILNLDYIFDDKQCDVIYPLASYAINKQGKIELLYTMKFVGREPIFYLPDIAGLDIAVL